MFTVLGQDGEGVRFSSFTDAALFAADGDLEFEFEVETRAPIHRKGKKNRKFDEAKAGRKQKALEQKFYAEMEN